MTPYPVKTIASGVVLASLLAPAPPAEAWVGLVVRPAGAAIGRVAVRMGYRMKEVVARSSLLRNSLLVGGTLAADRVLADIEGEPNTYYDSQPQAGWAEVADVPASIPQWTHQTSSFGHIGRHHAYSLQLFPGL